MKSFFDPAGLTGLRRHRTMRRWGRELLILQVQEHGSNRWWEGGFCDSDPAVRWRDATVADITPTKDTPNAD